MTYPAPRTVFYQFLFKSLINFLTQTTDMDVNHISPVDQS